MKLNIAENIRQLRKGRSLTQEQLAEALGVTVGAVYKWESGRATPDISLIVEMAAFFETSVDVLLGYELFRTNASQTAESLRRARLDKRTEEGRRMAEAALQKYPNSFEVVHESALLYYVSLTPDCALRAIELFERACGLLDQNDDPEIGISYIRSNIAGCYIVRGETDRALDLLKSGNDGGVNNDMIGLILAQQCQKPEAALEYLSHSLGGCITRLFRTVVGLLNAYCQMEKYDLAFDISLWMHEVLAGLRSSNDAFYLDKGDSMLLGLCAHMSLKSGDREAARRWLREARDTALRFDASPNYGVEGIKFFHTSEKLTAYDDIGETAEQGILNYITVNGEDAADLAELWEELCNEEK